MTIRGLGVVATWLLAGTGCVSNDVPTAPTAIPAPTTVVDNAASQTAYDVYRAALGQLGPLGGGHPLVVRERTATFFWCPGTAGSSAGDEWREASESYLAVNQSSERLIGGANLGTPYELLTNQRYSEYFGSTDLADAWRRFKESYPSGTLVTFSAVGFNADRTRAVLQLGVQCGGLCGQWRDFYLHRQGDVWRVTPLVTCRAIS